MVRGKVKNPVEFGAKISVTMEKRVAFLSMGLGDYELTRAVSYAFRAYKQGGDIEDYLTALRDLDQYRSYIETHNVANMGYLRYKEFLWDRTASSNLSRDEH